MQYLQRRLHRSVTDKRKLRSGLPKASATLSLSNSLIISCLPFTPIPSPLTPYLSRILRMLFYPDFAFRRVFELPDRRDLFQFIDCPLAGTERLSSMLSPHDNQYDVFADTYFTIPVEDRNLDNVKILQRPFANFVQLLLRHTLIMFERNAVYLSPSG